MHWLKAFFVVSLLWIVPSSMNAAEPLDWKTHGLIALTIAICLSVGLIWKNKELDTAPARIMAFGVYFWVIIFSQAILYGLYYGFVR
ncbi:hypothetical protein [Pleionea sediminis]|uniref:hypothetical protein n=1 Tax=Pleionea sediminis TaxID=2569479 RepID=UPI001185B21C|nr:hypothetical protein [Pleionea sediminis]